MFRCRRPHHALGALILLASMTARPAIAATSETQLWVTGSVVAKASDADTLSFDIGRRFRARRSDDEQSLARMAIDHRIAEGIHIGGGLGYLEGRAEKEVRLFQQLTLMRGIWTARTRLEQRFFNGFDRPGWRLRQRIQAAIPVKSDKRWTVILANETMFHLNHVRPSDETGVATIRNQIGLRRAISRAVDVQLLYMNQVQLRRNRPTAVAHIPWLTLSWRI
jgi:hypothetical protein